MITSKQRAFLRSIASELDTIIQIGKNGIGENLITTVKEALDAHELIKLRVFESSPVSSRDAADILANETESDVVQVIGTRFVLYKAAKKPKIVLP